MGKLHCKVENKWCKFLKRGICTYCNTNLTGVSRCPRISEIETIRFSDILKMVTFNDAFNAMCKWFRDQEQNIEGYRSVFNKLLKMVPKKHELADMFIRVEIIDEDGEQWLSVDGIDPMTKKYYGIEFCPWIDWISMFLTSETLDNLSYEEIVGACLYEMTFFGFSEDTVKRKEE